MMGLGILLGLVLPSAHALGKAPPQLNIAGFASCLEQSGPAPDLDAVREQYRPSSLDLLILHLALYPGKTLPGLDAAHRQAYEDWEVAYENLDAQFARALGDLTRGPVNA